MNPRLLRITAIAMTVSFCVPGAAFAAFNMSQPPVGLTAPNINDLNDVTLFFMGAGNWAFYFLLIFAVLAVLIAAYKYLTSGGEPDEIKTANKMLLYAAIAVGVGVFALVVPRIVGSIFGVMLP